MKESDLAAALTALERERAAAAEAATKAAEACPSPARTNRRAALGLALLGLLVGGVLQVTAPESVVRDPGRDSRAAKVFSSAETGACLSWPPDQPDKPSFVQCSSDHLFEVATAVRMDGFGEPCERAVSAYLGEKYDPDGRFTSGVLWAGDASAAPADRSLLCGLQMLGIGGRPQPFRGLVAELDQSKVWPPGTCLGGGAGSAASRPSDVVVDCAEPHAAEVSGSVGLGQRFTAGPPSESEQEAFLRDECTILAEGYLAPRGLPGAGLVSEPVPLSRASWNAGSRQASCLVAPPTGPDWKPLVGRVGREGSDLAPAAPAPPSVPVPPPAPVPSAVPSPTPVTTPVTTPSAAPTTPPPSPSPTPSSSPPSTPPSPAPSSTAPPAPSTAPSPSAPETPVSPPPAAQEVVATPEPPPPNVILIPGLPPITLPAPPP